MKSSYEFYLNLKNHKLAKLNNKILMYGVIWAFLTIAIFLLTTFVSNPSDVVIVIFGILIISFLIVFVLLSVLIIYKNFLLFKEGELFKGILSILFIYVFVIFVLIVIFYNSNEAVKPIVSTLISLIASLVVGILAIMGVYFTQISKKIDLINENKIIFELSDTFDCDVQILSNQGINSQNFCIKNLTNNFGFFLGIYQKCGNDVYKLGEPLNYCVIKPLKSYRFSNLKFLSGNDEIILVYKDNLENVYYLALSLKQDKIDKILQSEKCDYDYLKSTLIKNKKYIETASKLAQEINFIYTKENTKPIYTQSEFGFDLIIDENGEILTDTNLLKQLRAKRRLISKEQKCKDFFVFTNKQLVALATYKPVTEKQFISIYGLGEIKYKMYGEQMINIIKNYKEDKA